MKSYHLIEHSIRACSGVFGQYWASDSGEFGPFCLESEFPPAEVEEYLMNAEKLTAPLMSLSRKPREGRSDE